MCEYPHILNITSKSDLIDFPSPFSDIPFMAGFYNGRNGSDQLSVFLIAVAVVLAVAASVIDTEIIRMAVIAPALALAAWAVFRMMSRNIGRRRNENDTFLSLIGQSPEKKARRADRKTHRYFRCPKCKEYCRVPRNKGKIRITCPHCGEQFIKRT